MVPGGKIKNAVCLALGCILYSTKTDPEKSGDKGVPLYDLGCKTTTAGTYPPAKSTPPATTTATTAAQTDSSVKNQWEGDNAIVICATKSRGSVYSSASTLLSAGLVDSFGNLLINHIELGQYTSVSTKKFAIKGDSSSISRYKTTNTYLTAVDDNGLKKSSIYAVQMAVNNAAVSVLADACAHFQNQDSAYSYQN